MKRAVGWAVACLLGVLACAGGAQASPAAPRFSFTVDRTVVHVGERITVTATSTVRCTWLVEWDGQRRHTVGRTFVTTFTAPVVTRKSTVTLSGRCFYSAPGPQRPNRTAPTAATRSATDPQTIQVFVPPSWARSRAVTVLPGRAVVSPPQTGGGGVGPLGLPNTGGPSLWLIVSGLALLVAGASVVRRSRRSDLDAFSVRP